MAQPSIPDKHKQLDKQHNSFQLLASQKICCLENSKPVLNHEVSEPVCKRLFYQGRSSHEEPSLFIGKKKNSFNHYPTNHSIPLNPEEPRLLLRLNSPKNDPNNIPSTFMPNNSLEELTTSRRQFYAEVQKEEHQLLLTQRYLNMDNSQNRLNVPQQTFFKQIQKQMQPLLSSTKSIHSQKVSLEYHEEDGDSYLFIKFQDFRNKLQASTRITSWQQLLQDVNLHTLFLVFSKAIEEQAQELSRVISIDQQQFVIRIKLRGKVLIKRFKIDSIACFGFPEPQITKKICELSQLQRSLRHQIQQQLKQAKIQLQSLIKNNIDREEIRDKEFSKKIQVIEKLLQVRFQQEIISSSKVLAEKLHSMTEEHRQNFEALTEEQMQRISSLQFSLLQQEQYIQQLQKRIQECLGFLDKHDHMCNLKLREMQQQQKSALKAQDIELNYLNSQIKKLISQIDKCQESAKKISLQASHDTTFIKEQSEYEYAFQQSDEQQKRVVQTFWGQKATQSKHEITKVSPCKYHQRQYPKKRAKNDRQ